MATERQLKQDIVDIARRWWAGFNEDGHPPLDLCDERVEIMNPLEFPITGPFHGHAGVRKWASDVWEVMDELRVEPVELIEVGDGEAVVAALQNSGRMKHTGLSANARWAAVMTFRGGRLVHAQGYMSKAEALEAVGLRE